MLPVQVVIGYHLFQHMASVYDNGCKILKGIFTELPHLSCIKTEYNVVPLSKPAVQPQSDINYT